MTTQNKPSSKRMIAKGRSVRRNCPVCFLLTTVTIVETDGYETWHMDKCKHVKSWRVK